MEPFCQSRLITAKITYFSNEIQLSLNHILSELFEIIGVNKQMFISFGQDEPHRSPKEAYFNCVIGIYFLSFFYEHPVDGRIFVATAVIANFMQNYLLISRFGSLILNFQNESEFSPV